MVPKVKDLYKEKVAISLKEQFLYSNVMEIPRLQRIVLNIGLGRLSDGGKDMKVIEDTANELSLITGQRAVITRARKSIAGFKLREGVPIGCMVTLRGNKMYEFFDRLVNLALPRVRDFRGFSSNSFDGKGNYTFGIKEHIIFPEIDYSKVEKQKGLNITIVTTSNKDEEALELLRGLGMPFRKN
ncbi:50S ribosomal protein L5 [Desulfobacterota bacterium AH_259_B03_O07]|nr:50S ribosomal protein L5 [Desulfobacterota bacterium AH_259_B03_O07]